MRIIPAIPYQIYGKLSTIPTTQLRIDQLTIAFSMKSLKRIPSSGPLSPSKNLEIL